MEIKILGTGCAKCTKLEELTRKVVAENNIEANVEKVEDIQEILDYGVMMTPGLVINGNVVLKGQLPKTKELTNLILKHA